MKTDSLFYRLFSTFPQLIFSLMGSNQSAKGYGFASEEIKQTSFRHDGILKPLVSQPKSPIVFVEVQFQKKDDFYSRFFTEISLYLRHQNPVNPWQAIVIYPTHGQESQYRIYHYEGWISSPNFHIVYLDGLLKKLTHVPGLRFLKLIVASKKDVKKQAKEMVRNRQYWSHFYNLSQADLLDFIETIIVYKFSNLTRDRILDMLDITNINIQDTAYYKDAHSKGKIKGKIEGKIEGKLELTLKVLYHNFPNCPSYIHEQISILNNNQLNHLFLKLLDFSEINEVKNWLKTTMH